MTAYAKRVAAHTGYDAKQMDNILKDEAASLVDYICDYFDIEPDGFALWPNIIPETGEPYHCLTLNGGIGGAQESQQQTTRQNPFFSR